MTVTKLAVYRSRATIAALQSMLSMAERGELESASLGAVLPNGEVLCVMTGRCRDDPETALKVAMKMSWAATQLQDENDEKKSHPALALV
jgi:hypothetical protein